MKPKGAKQSEKSKKTAMTRDRSKIRVGLARIKDSTTREGQ